MLSHLAVSGTGLFEVAAIYGMDEPEPEEFDAERWMREIQAGLCLQRGRGGGEMLIHHPEPLELQE